LVPSLGRRRPLARYARNRFGHANEVLVQSWQLILWMLEPLILRILGHGGRYANRLNPSRWMGTTERVPWVS
jgi:hypothetical protein